MNSVVGTWFSFSQDADCLAHSVESARSSFAGIKIAICDDGRSPVAPSDIRKIDPDHYERSDVPRRKNLRGCDAVCMILDFQERMLNKYGCEQSLKIDCDTAVFSDRWVSHAAPFNGFEQLTPPYALGCCRSMSAEAVSSVLSSFLSRYQDPNHNLCEDQTITYHALLLYGPRCNIHPQVPRRAVGWDYRNSEKPDFVFSADVVSFGNRHTMPRNLSGSQRRKLAAQTMLGFMRIRQ